MEFWEQLLSNKVLLTAALSWFFAQFFKMIINLCFTKKLDLRRMWGSGGMPSAHSAMVCGLTVSIARFYGVSNPVFALAAMFAFVTMYDAMGVRRETGEHAKLLNKYIAFLKEQEDENKENFPDIDADQKQLKEFVGHTPLQVLGGVLLGILVGILIPV